VTKSQGTSRANEALGGPGCFHSGEAASEAAQMEEEHAGGRDGEPEGVRGVIARSAEGSYANWMEHTSQRNGLREERAKLPGSPYLGEERVMSGVLMRPSLWMELYH
jgi:hypothetical protein